MINNKKPWAKHYSEEALSYNPDKMRYQSLSDLFFDVGGTICKEYSFHRCSTQRGKCKYHL